MELAGETGSDLKRKKASETTTTKERKEIREGLASNKIWDGGERNKRRN